MPPSDRILQTAPDPVSLVHEVARARLEPQYLALFLDVDAVAKVRLIADGAFPRTMCNRDDEPWNWQLERLLEQHLDWQNLLKRVQGLQPVLSQDELGDLVDECHHSGYTAAHIGFLWGLATGVRLASALVGTSEVSVTETREVRDAA